MQDPQRLQMLTEDQAKQGAEHDLAPDVYRAFDQLETAGLLDWTNETERIRITEIYATRYALWRASIQANPGPAHDRTIPWQSDDELLNLVISNDGTPSYPDLLSRPAILHLLDEPDWGSEASGQMRHVYATMIHDSLRQLVAQVSDHQDLPPNPNRLDQTQRERLAHALRDRDLIATFAPASENQARLTHRSALVGAELLDRA